MEGGCLWLGFNTFFLTLICSIVFCFLELRAEEWKAFELVEHASELWLLMLLLFSFVGYPCTLYLHFGFGAHVKVSACLKVVQDLTN